MMVLVQRDRDRLDGRNRRRAMRVDTRSTALLADKTISEVTRPIMASRQPSIFALLIINKAGGLIYQKNYAGSRRFQAISDT